MRLFKLKLFFKCVALGVHYLRNCGGVSIIKLPSSELCERRPEFTSRCPLTRIR